MTDTMDRRYNRYCLDCEEHGEQPLSFEDWFEAYMEELEVRG